MSTTPDPNPSPTDKAEVFTKSSRYWISDGSIHFRVATTLYKVHKSNFIWLSPVVADILDIPDNMPEPQQGDEANPIVLEFFTTEVFEDFLAWIYRGAWQPLENTDVVVKERMLVNLLRVGSLWEITEAIVYAKSTLHTMYLSPARKLELARMFSLLDRDWIDKPIRRLITNELNIIAQAKETLWFETRLACSVPPKLEDAASAAWVSDEHDHRVCVEVFNEVWWGRIAKKVMDPFKPWAWFEVAENVKATPFQVQRVGGWKVLADQCKADVVARIEAEGFFSENAVIEAAAQAVERYFRSL
ncbi:hypothetical protein C8R45DRAFT_1172266 [Mycena sanguinolenta]|nr:hypothetical protein C8R45DRAFT_1106324 [Mycena sanguinolenta]KAJ6466908.1 hypothetical protein C8R45DRAFT_1172266 [Mycena sanguinolenta]